MAKKQTYQYTIWYRDPKDTDKDKKIGDVASVDAVNEDHVKRIAIRSLSADWDDKIENIEVIVRPF